MSTRYNDGSHYENHQREAELHDAGAHAHRAAEQDRDKQDHLTGQQHSRLELEHSQETHDQQHGTSVGHGVTAFGHDDIAALAYQLWDARGRPADGLADEDWFHAVKELRSRAIAR